MHGFLRALLTLALAASLAAPVAGEGVNHPSYAMYRDGELEILLWVSEAVLDAPEPPEGFPAGLRPTVERARRGLERGFWSPSGCTPQPHGQEPTSQLQGEPGASPVSAEYVDFLASSAAVVAGEVQQIEPGAVILGEPRIGPRVRVSLSEVLRDEKRSLLPGDELTYFGNGGRLRIGGSSLCLSEEPDRGIPKAGDRVILTGSRPSAEDQFVDPSTVFRLRDDTVTLPVESRFMERAILLQDLRLAAGRNETTSDGVQPSQIRRARSSCDRAGRSIEGPVIGREDLASVLIGE